MKRLLFLIAGFGLGQGSMFLAQSYLIYEQQFSLASASAIGLGFLSLAYWMTEMGGIFTFNKAFQKNKSEISSYFAARAVLAASISIISAAIITTIKIGDDILRDLAKIIPAIPLATTISLLAYIDATNQNHKISHLSGLPWIFSAAALIAPPEIISTTDKGYTIGLAFLAGQLVFTLAQHIYLRENLKEITIKDIKTRSVLSYFGDGVAYNISFSASQLYGRATPLIIDHLLGAKLCAIYIYTRNITNMLSQISIFARRVEFTNLRSIRSSTPKTLISNQKISSTLTGIFFLATLSAAALIHTASQPDDMLADIASILSLQVFVYLAFNISGLYSQPLTAHGGIRENARIQAIQSTICMALAYPALKYYGINLMLATEITVTAIGVMVYSHQLKKTLEKGGAA